MLEYMSYQKYKKYKDKKEAKEAEEKARNNGRLPEPKLDAPGPVLSSDDEAFLEAILSSSDEGLPPPLPMRPTFDRSSYSDNSYLHSDSRDRMSDDVASTSASTTTATKSKTKEKEKVKKKRTSHNPISFLLNRKDREKDMQLVPVVPLEEADREREDLSRVLEDLNLSAKNNKAFALSAESNELVRKFTLVLKDLVNGVPTAIDDLKNLIEDRDGTLKKNYDKLPSSMKKLVAQLPDKVSENMGPEFMAAAARGHGLKADEVPQGSSMKDAAKSLFMPKNLQDILTKPTAIIGMLKSIVSFLKLRWPAFIGVNVVWSVAIFLLLLVLWYCHKRGREVRLERERSAQSIDGRSRVEELPDDPMLPAPSSRRSSRGSDSTRRSSRHHSGTNTPRIDENSVRAGPRRRHTQR
ncbi:hypothetical protein SODALDRAFT_339754 [Sodiomyces alkalinus F11]|uniref:Ring-like domain-containing protein n=1 Tax=Sodiomyces alkalinus (strain CBS 110278 / VKM F-3762 / F11) TaxID=1314773 RepID=A0A3N2PYD5_SODAK|nr:hypothetical protein SODALDRAFT_339754 [Sodiomyces alkalinus F11]ROT39426.1 hypothetical protein SODALDRAFT_339754 [Sodiomyces alkalinus F11]